MSVGKPNYLVTLVTLITQVTLVTLATVATLVVLSTLVNLFRASNQLQGRVYHRFGIFFYFM